MDHVYQAYIAGDAGDFDDVFARTLDGAKAAAEELYDDYYGDPINWGKEQADMVSGQFFSGPHEKQTVIVCKQEVDPR